jgi:NifU-like protein
LLESLRLSRFELKIALVSFYPTKISERFNSPKNAGIAESPNAKGVAASFACGSIVQISLRIEDKEIREVKFKTNGCGFMIAAAEVISESIANTRLQDFDRVELKQKLMDALGDFPVDRTNCLDVCFEALQKAFQAYRKTQIEEFAGEKALICTCFGVSEETIEDLVTKNSLESVEEVSIACNAGSGCGSCQLLIQEIIDSAVTY